MPLRRPRRRELVEHVVEHGSVQLDGVLHVVDGHCIVLADPGDGGAHRLRREDGVRAIGRVASLVQLIQRTWHAREEVVQRGHGHVQGAAIVCGRGGAWAHVVEAGRSAARLPQKDAKDAALHGVRGFPITQKGLLVAHGQALDEDASRLLLSVEREGVLETLCHRLARLENGMPLVIYKTVGRQEAGLALGGAHGIVKGRASWVLL